MSHLKINEIGAKLPIYIVKKKSPAFDALKKVSRNYRPGALIPVTNEEFESLKVDVILLKF